MIVNCQCSSYNIKVKWKTWKQSKSGDSKEEYLKAKTAKVEVYFAKKMLRLNSLPASTTIVIKPEFFKMTKRLKWDNVDVVGEKCVQND